MRLIYRIVIVTMIAVALLLFTGYLIAATYDYNKFKPEIIRIVKELTGRDLSLDGDIRLKPGLLLTASVEDGAFQNAPWGSRPNMLKIKRIEVQAPLFPLLRGEFVFKGLTLVEPRFLIENDPSGKSNLALDVPAPEEVESELEEMEEKEGLRFNFESFQIQDGELSIKNGRTGETHVVAVNRLDIKRGQGDEKARVEIKGAWNDAPFQLSGAMGPLYTVFTRGDPFPLDIKVSASDAALSAVGEIQNLLELKGIDLKFSARGKEIATILKMIRERPRLNGPFHFSGHLTGEDPAHFKVSGLNAGLGDMKIGGFFSYAENREKPSVEAKLTSDKLDFRPFYEPDRKKAKSKTPETPGTASGTKPSGAPRVFSDAPFDLQVFHAMDASIHLQIGQLLLPKLALDNLEQNFTLKDGRLKISPFKAHVGGGRLRGAADLRVEKKGVAASVQMEVRRFDLGEMLKELGISDKLDGSLDLDFNLSGKGNSAAEMAAGLNGDFIGHMKEGAMPLKYIKLFGADFSANLINLFNPFHKKIDHAMINCMVFDFHIQNGMVDSDVILVDSPQVTALVDGKLNLKTEALDFGIKPRPKEGVGIKGVGKVSVSLGEFTTPWRLKGTLASPSLGVGPSETVRAAGKAAGFTALLGPAGLVSLFVSGSLGEKDPCAKALELAGKGGVEKKSLFGIFKK
ncbi:MAG: AsmA family protein [Desulfobacterales bacterium]|nr:AsmA family protein [Desulfobacterales bacterium]